MVDPFEQHCVETSGGTEVRIYDVGYEDGVWRCEHLVKRFMFEHLISFVLGHRTAMGVNHNNAARMLYDAASRLYKTPKYSRRGEFGELLLHALLIQFYGVEPLLSKLQFKTASNMTVNGFDSVHIAVSEEGEIQLWLGESKLYANFGKAIKEAISSLRVILSNEKLREEFAWFVDKIDQDHKYREEIINFISVNTSLDKIKPNIIVPILITYDSRTISNFTQTNEEFISELLNEARGNIATFHRQDLNVLQQFTLKLIFMPTKSVSAFRELADEHLRVLQQLG